MIVGQIKILLFHF